MAIQYLERSEKPRLAYHSTPAGQGGENLPTVMFLGGFRSDMEGTKALYLEARCRDRGQAYIRFDYSGHGVSEGRFEDGTIGLWKDDALTVFDGLTREPVILVGSSMGGWIALLIALARPARVAGVVGIAAAPDFTREIFDGFNEEQKEILRAQGHVDLPSAYSETPYRITRALIEDGEQHCLLDRENRFAQPLRLIQGMKDDDVPWQKPFRLKQTAPESDIEVLLVESGDHRLSRPEDLELIDAQVMALSGLV